MSGVSNTCISNVCPSLAVHFWKKNEHIAACNASSKTGIHIYVWDMKTKPNFGWKNTLNVYIIITILPRYTQVRMQIAEPETIDWKILWK